jgi:large subunit ribosomal protein L53
MSINAQLLPRASTEPSSLHIKFSQCPIPSIHPSFFGQKRLDIAMAWWANRGMKITEDGKEMKLDCEAMGIKSIIEEVDRHSRVLQKEADLAAA